MKIEKAKGLQLGEKVYKAIKKKLDGNDDGNLIYVDTFNNCRETGYCFKFYRAGDTKQNVLWVYEYRMSDDIVLRDTLDSNWHDINNRYDDEGIVYAVRMYKHDAINELIDDVLIRIETFFGGKADD